MRGCVMQLYERTFINMPLLGRPPAYAFFTLIVVLMTGLMAIAAETTAQQVTLREQKAKLSDVLLQIGKQTGYNIAMKKQLLDRSKEISIHLDAVSLEDALEKVLQDQPFAYSIDPNLQTILIQERKSPLVNVLVQAYPEVRGRVTDSLERPLVGATVRVLDASGKRTALAATTDQEGVFLLRNVPDDAQLEVTYLGYMKYIVSKVSTELGLIKLRAVLSNLDAVEVMVNTGYQILPKERATGSFVQINKKLFNTQTGSTVLERLEAITSGLMVDRSSAAVASNNGIRIRGLSSILGPKEALVVVDNFPYDGDINNINPNDVENITVLRDAAAASIWGAKAGNGVIVITTKKGKFDQPIRIETNNTITIGDVPDLQNLEWHMNASDYVGVEEMLYQNGYYNAMFTSTSYNMISPVVELFRERETAAAVRVEEIDKQIDFYRQNDVRDDYRKYIYQPSINQQYHLGVSGGSSKSSWSSSVGYGNNATVLSEKQSRLNLRFHHQYAPFQNLKFITGVSYTQTSADALSFGIK